jgi:pentatricopeptide repeat protein
MSNKEEKFVQCQIGNHILRECQIRNFLNVVMVTGLTQNGLRSEALDVFRRMKAAGFSVDLWRPCYLRKGEADPCLHNQNYVWRQRICWKSMPTLADLLEGQPGPWPPQQLGIFSIIHWFFQILDVQWVSLWRPVLRETVQHHSVSEFVAACYGFASATVGLHGEQQSCCLISHQILYGILCRAADQWPGGAAS